MNQSKLKQQAAEAALEFIDWDMIVGVGSGSTVNCFIDALAEVKNKFECAVSSSEETTRRLKALNIPVVSLNDVGHLDVYVDGADEINAHFQMIKGGGGALTREKILASAAKKFICIADASKKVETLGHFPVAVEVIPMARSVVARQIVALGGSPEYRQGFTTDNGNIILDVYHLDLTDPSAMENTLNNIPGVVCNGVFSSIRADVALLASEDGISKLQSA